MFSLGLRDIYAFVHSFLYILFKTLKYSIGKRRHNTKQKSKNILLEINNFIYNTVSIVMI